MKKKLDSNDIGKIIKIKKDNKLWSTIIQENIYFDKDIYVQLTNVNSSPLVYSGNIIEPNVFGALVKSEVEFYNENIEYNEIYSSIEEFNDIKCQICS